MKPTLEDFCNAANDLYAAPTEERFIAVVSLARELLAQASARWDDGYQFAMSQHTNPCQTCEALARTVMCDQTSSDAKPAAYAVRQIGATDEGTEQWADIHTSPDVARETADALMSTGQGERYEVIPLFL